MAGYDKMIMVPEIPQATQTIESQEKRKKHIRLRKKKGNITEIPQVTQMIESQEKRKKHTRPRKKKGEKNTIKECMRRRKKKKKKRCSNDKLLELLIDLI